MHDDLTALREINARIGTAESDGDAAWLQSILAPQLAFRRVNGQYNTRDEFLASLASGPGRHTEIVKIELYGDRAVVSCNVTSCNVTSCNVTVSSGQTGTSSQSVDRYRNLRLFVRETDGWKLLGWANQRWNPEN